MGRRRRAGRSSRSSTSGRRSPATARPVVETRELDADDWVYIPTGVAHGFLALEPLQLIYLVTNEYDGSDELGFAWDDPAVAVPWPALEATPDGRPILSDRDADEPAAGRPGGAPAPHPALTRTAPLRPAPHTAPNRWG